MEESMLSKIIFVFLMVALPGCVYSQTGCGYLVVEENTIVPESKTVVFVAGKNIERSTTVSFDMVNSEGKVSSFNEQTFEKGIMAGQIIKLWNGEFNMFSKTPWLYLDIQLQNYGLIDCFRRTMIPIDFPEQYKEPQIRSIIQTGFGNSPAFRIELIYDSTEKFELLANTYGIISRKQISATRPGEIEFSLDQSQIRKGKFLLTICQNNYCDSMPGRYY